MSFLQEFKEFISKGNVMDMAVGIIIGSAFTAIVSSLVADIVTPFIGVITGGIDFGGLTLTVGSAEVTYGNFINAVIQFLLIAFVVFMLIRTLNKAQQRLEAAKGKAEAEADVVAPTCPFCLEDVKPGATRCPHCGGEFASPAKETVAEA